MKKVALFLIVFFTAYRTNAQDDEVSNVISRIFFTKEVYKIVFYDLSSTRRTAFIFGNRLLQTKYADLLGELSRNKFRINYIKDPKGTIVVMGDAFYNSDVDLYTVFDLLDFVEDDRAEIRFHTTSLYKREQMKDRYVEGKCRLKKKNGNWKIVKLELKPIACCDKVFGEIEVNEH